MRDVFILSAATVYVVLSPLASAWLAVWMCGRHNGCPWRMQREAAEWTRAEARKRGIEP